MGVSTSTYIFKKKTLTFDPNWNKYFTEIAQQTYIKKPLSLSLLKYWLVLRRKDDNVDKFSSWKEKMNYNISANSAIVGAQYPETEIDLIVL